MDMGSTSMLGERIWDYPFYVFNLLILNSKNLEKLD